jgi:hypothetical protein
MTMSAYRHTRQVRLAEVGEAGQSRLAAAEVEVRSAGFAGEVEARYLAGAGVGALRVASEVHMAAARAMDASVRLELGSVSAAPELPPGLASLEGAAREVAEGAYRALAGVRAALGGTDVAR